MRYPGANRHPLSIALLDDAAVGVVVGDLVVKDVRHCLDVAMRVLCNPLRLLGRIDQRTYIVEEQGRVGVTERRAAREAPPDRYSGH